MRRRPERKSGWLSSSTPPFATSRVIDWRVGDRHEPLDGDGLDLLGHAEVGGLVRAEQRKGELAPRDGQRRRAAARATTHGK